MVKMTSMTAVFVLIALAAHPASAAVVEDFESGFTDGNTIDGINGWVNRGGPGLIAGNAAGNPSWGVTSPGSYQGSKIAPGVSMDSGDMVFFSADIKPADGASTSYILLRADSTPSTDAYNLLIALDGTQYTSQAKVPSTIISGAMDINVAATVPAEWHHVQMMWDVGTGATAKIWDASDTLVYNETHTFADVLTFPFLEVYAKDAGNSFDNIWVNSMAVPEPSGLILLGLGLLSLAGFAGRRKIRKVA